MSAFRYWREPLCALAVCGFLGADLPEALATEFNVGAVMEKLDASARAPYVSGVIDGLASARYERDNEHLEGDNKTVAGMACIYAWYNQPGTLDLIYKAFDKYPSYPAGVIIGIMVRKSCGA